MTRHVKEFHNKDSSTSIDVKIQKQHVCPEIGCGKTFKFASKLEKHKDSHGKLHLNVLRASFSCVVHNLILYLKFWKHVKHSFEEWMFSAVKLESIEVVCVYPGCMKSFTNLQCLRAHTKSCHQYVNCETCGKKQLRKNIKRHLHKHETGSSSEVFHCDYKDCSSTFSSVRNS